MVRGRAKGCGGAVHRRSARVNPLPRCAPPRIHTDRTSRARRRAFGPLPRPPITAVIGPPEERLAPTNTCPQRRLTGGRDHDQPTSTTTRTEYRTVRIPGSTDHAGQHLITVTAAVGLPDLRRPPRRHHGRRISYDGSRRLACDGWTNPCGHIDFYADVRREARR